MKQQKYFTFRKPSDWNNGLAFHLDSYTNGLQIQKENQYRNVRKSSLPASYEEASWIDACVASNGRWYWLDDHEQIWRMERNFSASEMLFSLPKQERYVAHKISVHDDLLVVLYQTVQDEHPKRSMLQCYFMDSSQLKWQVEQFKDKAFLASSVLLLEDQSTVIAGAFDESEHVQILQFDKIGLAMNAVDVFRCSSKLIEDAISNCAEWDGRYQLLLNASDEVAFLDPVENYIVCWDCHHTVRYLMLDVSIADAVGMTIDELGQYWVLLQTRNEQEGKLIAFDDNGKLAEHGTAYSTRGHYLVARGTQLQMIDVVERFAYTLMPKLMPSFWEQKQSYFGVWLSMPLNSGEVGTEWHKIIVDAIIHHDTTINIRAFASDHLEVSILGSNIDIVQWLQQEEIPIEQKLVLLEPLWQQVILDPADALLKNMKGQFLWLCIELTGTDMHSPIMKGLDVYFPRQSYVSDLPVIFQRTDTGFLTNYLSLFQTLIEQTDESIFQAPRKLEASQNGGSSLRWLLGWLGIDSDDYWSEDQLRELLLQAPKLSNLRGTRYAIETLVKIYTGYKPIILEYDDIKPLKENIELREVVDRLYVTDPHTFNVLVKADVVDTELKRITLQHILDKYKPVFSVCKLVVLQPWVYMDLHSYLGMNTILTAPQQLLLDGISSMPHHTITLDLGVENQLDKHSRLGLNSRLE